jgi:chaperonin cofactor prefoldin
MRGSMNFPLTAKILAKINEHNNLFTVKVVLFLLISPNLLGSFELDTVSESDNHYSHVGNFLSQFKKKKKTICQMS